MSDTTSQAVTVELAGVRARSGRKLPSPINGVVTVITRRLDNSDHRDAVCREADAITLVISEGGYFWTIEVADILAALRATCADAAQKETT